MSLALLTTLLTASPPAPAPADGNSLPCAQEGATYAPRTSAGEGDIRYRLTIVAPPEQQLIVGWRYRFELSGARDGRPLSRLDLDYICGMGRAPCVTSPISGDERDEFVHSVVVQLNEDLSPVSGSQTPYAIVFANFSEHDWTTPLSLREVVGTRYYTAERILPDLSDLTVWVRAGCGPAKS